MKKNIIILLAIFIINIGKITGQNQTDSIQIKKGFGTFFIQHGKKLKPKELLEITRINEAAFQEMKTAKSNYDAGTVVGAIGGFLVGWPLGTAIAGGDPNWTLAGIGAGLIVVSIPFTVSYNKHATEAVNLYNDQIRQTSYRKLDFNLGLSVQGLSLKMTF